MKKSIKGYNELWPHVEFSHNIAPSEATKLSSFHIIYGQNPLTPLDFVPLPIITKFSWEPSKRAEEIKDLYTKVRARIERRKELAKN